MEGNVSKATGSRMPAYLRYLRDAAANGIEYVSSAYIASDMELSAVCVRKDLALVSSTPGKPRLGFEVNALMADIERFLGYHSFQNVVIIGAGQLGRAILGYGGFNHYGINVVAAFDNDPVKIGAVGDKTIYPMSRLPEVVKRSDVKVGVLTVPRQAAQSACDEALKAGIKSILSFVPVRLTVPEGVTVKYEDLAVSLATLCGESKYTK